MKYEVPIDKALIDELFPFWAFIFGEELPDFSRDVFLGTEERYNHGTLYLIREGKQLAGTCFTMHSKTVPMLAGLGEVTTDPQFRGRGIATTLCSQAVADFRAAGGEALFLGTVNPAAARIYYRLGWRKLAGANVMVNITSDVSPEEFLVDYFRKGGQVEVSLAGPDIRVPMIPLILTPHDWQVLDANVNLFSCRYMIQNSCMGLYPRYANGLEESNGAVFAARTEDGRVVGLSSARPGGADGCQIDGFIHHNFAPAWSNLIEAACEWARADGVEELWSVMSVEDEEKQASFESIGFVHDGSGDDFTLAGRTVDSCKMKATG
ncbi:GNAT family N-acetyltransferase [Chloroflexi bacterium TSY]|nr:GNAT family N-acetyltransferase [Chloroflexi bacterium TSY]